MSNSVNCKLSRASLAEGLVAPLVSLPRSSFSDKLLTLPSFDLSGNLLEPLLLLDFLVLPLQLSRIDFAIDDVSYLLVYIVNSVEEVVCLLL
jgi:hypothetical protein